MLGPHLPRRILDSRQRGRRLDSRLRVHSRDRRHQIGLWAGNSSSGRNVNRATRRNELHQTRANVTLAWKGRLSDGPATGCPVIDPLVEAISVPLNAALTSGLSFVVPGTCAAKRLTVTARLTDQAGATLANKSAILHIEHKRPRST